MSDPKPGPVEQVQVIVHRHPANIQVGGGGSGGSLVVVAVHWLLNRLMDGW